VPVDQPGLPGPEGLRLLDRLAMEIGVRRHVCPLGGELLRKRLIVVQELAAG
jgi:hypothetical protein